MGTVSTAPVEEARSIFSDLGYTVTGDGPEFSAQRKWRSVTVRVIDEPDNRPQAGELCCFVTWREDASDLRRRLLSLDPEYDWAVIGVDGDDYEVVHAPAA